MSQTVIAPALEGLKRALAETLARSRIDYSDELMVLGAFLTDFDKGAGVSAREMRGHWEAAFREGFVPGHRLRLELVFPYCQEKCLYCNLGTRAPSSRSQLLRYAQEVKEELRFFSPAFSGAVFQSLWVGRGTPSLLEARELESLLSCINDSYLFDPGGLRGIECNPASVDLPKIRMLREMGFNQISFGVESLNSEVLRLVRRGYQDYPMIERAVAWAREAGFDDFNLDLVFGLHGETVESFIDNFRAVAGLRPTTITVCNLTLTAPYMKATGATRQSHLRHMQAILEPGIRGLRAAAQRSGYDARELSEDKGVWRLFAREATSAHYEKWARCDLESGGAVSQLGVGLKSRSHIFGRMLYQRLPRKFDAEAPIYHARPGTQKEEMAYYVLNMLNLRSRVDFSDFKKCFGRDFKKSFSEELKILSEFGKIREDGEGIRFLPVHIPERIFYGSVFILDTLRRSPYSKGRLGHAGGGP